MYEVTSRPGAGMIRMLLGTPQSAYTLAIYIYVELPTTVAITPDLSSLQFLSYLLSIQEFPTTGTHHFVVPPKTISEASLIRQLALFQYHSCTMTRSHKLNDRDHTGPAEDEHLPRYFAKTGPVAVDPHKTKKNGAGKGNWGRSGEEVQDYEYTFTNTRRHSNSSNHGLTDFKTKFETVEAEPVFEEELHGQPEPGQTGAYIISKVDSNESSGSTTESAKD
ncbi:hypothetical protein DTO027B5_5717 [Paecilomyces variotii]|nr:hypothetical protein DTO169C6_8303 [Paecilomyces variotii]KAJ9234556.1 hypothetical protein DTO169E5_6507 [Paecilomyces variotii]KAJ9246560.1 hypothetical protein DTO207G8_8831 [Paecilomyces variotii]KAJ9264098.1 hypothetical protein DTO195F2_2625 [Paecilomyces variotii]KAJ9287004.1 hypothetical protein DTO021C3_5336 [Paecilomyces variotii]